MVFPGDRKPTDCDPYVGLRRLFFGKKEREPTTEFIHETNTQLF